MSTIYSAGARTLAAKLMTQPEWAQLIMSWQLKLSNGEASTRDFAVYGQPGWSSTFPLEELTCAVFAHTMVMNGKWAWKTFFLDCTPRSDREREANAAGLARLPHPVKADVDMTQMTADEDGFVSWTEPIQFKAATIPRDADGPLIAHAVTVDPYKVPLEIGSTAPSRTLTHLRVEGGVARWPYGADYLQVLVDVT